MPFAIPECVLLRRALIVALAVVGVVMVDGTARAQSGVPAADVPLDTTARPVGVLRPGDLIKVHVYRDSELSGEYLIDPQGNVQIPGLGVVRASGLDPTQVKESLVSALRSRGVSSPEIAVQPLVRVSVLGEVRNPALYPVDPGTALIQLLTLAGGPTDRASLKRTRVVRDGKAFVVDLESGLSGSAAGRIVLYSNDVVYVPRKAGLTRETLSFVFAGLSVALSVVNVILATRRP